MATQSNREALRTQIRFDDDTLTNSSFGNDCRSEESSISSGTSTSVRDTEKQKASDRFRCKIKGVKRVVKRLMARHGGSTRHPGVTKMINKLEELNPTDQPAKSDLLVGEFICHSSPDFPGRIRRRDDVIQYSLGRLSFGIFQPNSLVCTVRAVRNSIQVCKDTDLLAECADKVSPSALSYTYPIIIDLTIHTPCGADLHAEMRHEAICYEMPHNAKRLGVTFLGGSLMPAKCVLEDPELLALWMRTFANAYKIAEEERSYFGKIFMYVLKWWLKLSIPTDEEAEKSRLHMVRYEMKRRPKGHMDVLFLDDDLRVTRGNRGTVIVVERLPHEADHGPEISSLSVS